MDEPESSGYQFAMKFFRKPAPRSEHDEPANETTPGVRMLKEVWHIEGDKKPREVVEKGSVSSDIYAMTPRNGTVPPRHHGRSSGA